MNEVVQGIKDFSKIKVAYIPTGSSNDLSRSLANKFRNENRSQNKNQTQNENKNPNKNQNLTKDHAKQGKGRTDKNKYGNKANHRIKKQLENILENEQVLEMNIGKATLYDEEGTVLIRKRFIVSSGVGFDAAVCEEAQHSKIKETLNKFGLGKLTYVGIALKYLLTIRAMPCKITLDESEELSLNRFLFVACMNHPYEGGGFKFCPKADSTDGWLDLCILGEMAKWKMFFALPAAYKGKHVGFSDVCIKRAKRVSVTLEAPLFVHTDGEVPGMASKIEWELLDSKLRMIQ